MDAESKSKNVSLPPELQSPDIPEDTSEAEEYPMILNMQIAMYESKINDIKLRVERLKKRNEHLEEICESIQNSSEITKKKTENEIVELNSSISTETKQCYDQKKRCDEIKVVREENKNKHLQKIAAMEARYIQTKTRLISEVKSINANINTIDEFKSTGEKLKAKYDRLNKLMLHKEEAMQTILSNIEYKSKIHKENLKKESYKKVLEVSTNFHEELRMIVSRIVQRLTRENKVVENELHRVITDRTNMLQDNIDTETKIAEYTNKMTVSKRNEKRRIMVLKKQNEILKHLKQSHKTVTTSLSKLPHYDPNSNKNFISFLEKTIIPDITEHDFRRRHLENIYQKQLSVVEKCKILKNKTQFALQKCKLTLNKLRSAVKLAHTQQRNIDDEADSTDKNEFQEMKLKFFAHYLLNEIKDYYSIKWTYKSKSVETLSGPMNAYAEGDLGFHPKPVKLILPRSDRDDLIDTLSISLSTNKELEETSEKVEQVQLQRLKLLKYDSGSFNLLDSTSSLMKNSINKVSEQKEKPFYHESLGELLNSGEEFEYEHDFEEYVN